MSRHSILRDELDTHLDNLLEVRRFHDYCPNGLQVEGRAQVEHIVCGVTANQALIDAAIERGADTLLVHHGWLWKSEDRRVIGIRKKRLATVLAHDINLFAYHLPLDAHGELGNNAQLAQRLGWRIEGRFAEQDIGFFGAPAASTDLAGLTQALNSALARRPLTIGDPDRVVRRIAWCSGGAQDYFEAALATGADVFVSGEISEQTVNLARESGMAFIAAGHHATERYGVMALAAHLSQTFGVHAEFVDIDNPA